MLGAIPRDPVLVTLLAVAHQAAADQVLPDGEATMDLRHHMVERRAAAEGVAAIGATVVPAKVNLITG